MIFPSLPSGEEEVWAILAHREANSQRAIFRPIAPPPGQSPSAQPELVRKAIADGATALVVVPGDSPDLARALADAESKNVPVVLLGRPIDAPAGSKPFTYVEHEPFGPLAKRIVSTTLGDVKKSGRPMDGTVLLISDKVTDRPSADRLAALKSAVEAEGLTSIVNATFDSATPGSAKAAVLDAVKSHPDVIMALADEGEGILGASTARISLGGQPAFFVGGFAGYRAAIGTIPLQKESCFVDGRVDELARFAVVTALKRLKGESIEGRVDQGSVFYRGAGEIAQPVKYTAKITPEAINKGFDEMMSRPTSPKPTTLP
jgi:ABC-type sugar transport system substrate-binding protein